MEREKKISSALREFVLVSLPAAEDALSPGSKVFGASGGTCVVLHRYKHSVEPRWSLEE